MEITTGCLRADRLVDSFLKKRESLLIPDKKEELKKEIVIAIKADYTNVNDSMSRMTMADIYEIIDNNVKIAKYFLP